jgi:membrane-bound metal-dependent hydrolase YbcI (DUF457 family)
MFFKTHLVITLFFILIFFHYIQNPILFLPVSFIATALPDIDIKFSKIGHYKIFKIFNFFAKHRGIIHSFTFLAILSFFIFIFFKEILFAFVFPYSLHLLIDSFTISGIIPFYPLKFKIKGRIKTGGIIEKIFFASFFLIDLFLIFYKIYLILK